MVHEGLCPACSITGKPIEIVVGDPISVSEDVDLMGERREILHKWPWLRAVLLIFDVASLIGGLWLGALPGLAIGLVLLILGEILGPKLAKTIIITREHRSSR
jgi:hypothetical protein